MFLAAILAAWVAQTGVAIADNCGDPSDCFSSQRAAILALIAIATVAAFVVGGPGAAIATFFLASDLATVATGRDPLTWEKTPQWVGALGIIDPTPGNVGARGGTRLARELAEEVTEEAAERAVREAAERAVREGTEEVTEEAAERALREGTEEVAEQAAPRAAGALSKPSSRALGRNLEAAGLDRPADAAAHHIAAGGAKRAAGAQSVLQRFGIDINTAENGVFLPKNLDALNPTGAAVHSTLHSNAYYSAVDDLLGQATTRAEALEALDYIRTELLAGRFP